MCNWTTWCTQNVLIVTSFTPQTEETRGAVCKKAAESLGYFLKDYTDDGCCDEGPCIGAQPAAVFFCAWKYYTKLPAG
jgi:hypothetical protein